MITIKELALHHTGGLLNNPFYSSRHFTAEYVNQLHKQRWNFKSSLGKNGGYNLFYELDGKRTQFRAIGEETAAQKGHNFDVISVCFAGNFIKNPEGKWVDAPSLAQLIAFKNDLIALLEYGSLDMVQFHLKTGLVK